MAVTIVTTQGLKNDLRDFRRQGDERWARASQISSLVSDALEDTDVIREEDMSGLSEEELSDLLSRI